MAKMNHPGIVKVYDFGETQAGLLYIVMEFIDGTDVSKMIALAGQAAGGLRAGDHGACV
jgi:serine/threonine protein kinase